MKIPPAQFKLLMDSIVWAFKHTMRNVAEIGLNVLLSLLQKFSQDQVGTQFFQTYFIDLMQHIFSVVTDSSHTASRCSMYTCLYTKGNICSMLKNSGIEICLTICVDVVKYSTRQ